MDLSQYLDMFIEESRDHLQALNEKLLELEQSPKNVNIINVIFRSAHTLKGMSATMGFEQMANLTHEMENTLELMRSSRLRVTSEAMDILFCCVDLLETMLGSIVSSGAEGLIDTRETIVSLQRLSDDTPKSEESKQFGEFNSFETTVLAQALDSGYHVFSIGVALEKDCVLRAPRAYMVVSACEELGEIIRAIPSVEELEQEKFERSFELVLITLSTLEAVKSTILNISEVESVVVGAIRAENLYVASVESDESVRRMAEAQIAATAQMEAQTPDTATSEQGVRSGSAPKSAEVRKLAGKTIRVDIDRLDGMMNLLSELVIDRTRLEQIARRSGESDLIETVEHMSRVSGDLQDIVMTIRMVPVETVFNRFPRMVRDLARDLGKQVNLVITGGETELDRTVIDEIGDPLVHLLRNALDHGLERPNERKNAGKNEVGQIQLRAYHSGNHVFIEVIEDGRGIDRDKVRNRGIEGGILSSLEPGAWSNEQVFGLLFHSGFSTADKVSDISGRGVGLDVVKSKIESLGGTIAIESTPGHGTRFIVRLPLTLSIIDAMLVVVSGDTLAIPLSSIVETALVQNDAIKFVHKQPTIPFRDGLAPVISLRNVLGYDAKIADAPQSTDEKKLVLVRKGEKVAALIVDDFIGQQEIVLKPLGQYLNSIFAISGATILGDGQVALILDPNALIY